MTLRPDNLFARVTKTPDVTTTTTYTVSSSSSSSSTCTSSSSSSSSSIDEDIRQLGRDYLELLKYEPLRKSIQHTDSLLSGSDNDLLKASIAEQRSFNRLIMELLL